MHGREQNNLFLVFRMKGCSLIITLFYRGFFFMEKRKGRRKKIHILANISKYSDTPKKSLFSICISKDSDWSKMYDFEKKKKQANEYILRNFST